MKKPYFLYVGNAYPHKNLEILIKATPITLVLVGKEDFFYKRLPRNKNTIYFGEATEEKLQNFYKNAVALIFPSLMEGFGLPGLEAMAAGAPVVCSDIPIFHEIYGDAALYFDPKNPQDISGKLQTIITDKKVAKSLVEKGKLQVKKYSWKEMAKKTLQAYLTS